MLQGRSVISRLMMGWMLLILGILSYRHLTHTPEIPDNPAASTETIWLR